MDLERTKFIHLGNYKHLINYVNILTLYNNYKQISFYNYQYGIEKFDYVLTYKTKINRLKHYIAVIDSVNKTCGWVHNTAFYNTHIAHKLKLNGEDY